MVERDLAKVDVAGPTPVSRLKGYPLEGSLFSSFTPQYAHQAGQNTGYKYSVFLDCRTPCGGSLEGS